MPGISSLLQAKNFFLPIFWEVHKILGRAESPYTINIKTIGPRVPKKRWLSVN